MKKCFIYQKVGCILYTITAVIGFLYALGFMTDYSDLFGLEHPKNASIAEFHDVMMQDFNFFIFAVAIAGVLMIALLIFLESFKRVPDLFALVLVECVSVIFIILSIISIVRLTGLESTYLSLDFKYLKYEGYTGTYELKTKTFMIGYIVYGLTVVSCLTMGIFSALSHFKYVKETKNCEVNEVNTEVA